MRDTAHETNESGKAGGPARRGSTEVRRECDMPQVGALMQCKASSRSAGPGCSWARWKTKGKGGGRPGPHRTVSNLESGFACCLCCRVHLGNASPPFRIVHSRERARGQLQAASCELQEARSSSRSSSSGAQHSTSSWGARQPHTVAAEARRALGTGHQRHSSMAPPEPAYCPSAHQSDPSDPPPSTTPLLVVNSGAGESNPAAPALPSSPGP
jgi:hypothetical protein